MKCLLAGKYLDQRLEGTLRLISYPSRLRGYFPSITGTWAGLKRERDRMPEVDNQTIFY